MGWIICDKGLQSVSFQCEELNNGQVIQAVSHRNSGNMALHTVDDPEQVVKRRSLYLRSLGLSLEQLVAANQVHGTEIQLVAAASAGRGSNSIMDALSGTDAMITRTPGVVLSIFTADCLPIFIYDPVTPAIGIAHAGWRGSIGRIGVKTLQKMTYSFGTNPKTCYVGLGPAICECCFVVSPEVAELFYSEQPEVVQPDGRDRFHVNLSLFNSTALIKGGVEESRIIDSKFCTACQVEDFFSYRMEQGTRGRMISVMGLK